MPKNINAIAITLNWAILTEQNIQKAGYHDFRWMFPWPKPAFSTASVDSVGFVIDRKLEMAILALNPDLLQPVDRI
jgi:hypothetical protein